VSYLESLQGEDLATVTALGWTRPCPGEKDPVPREIFKVTITDPEVPLEFKARVVLTARVHGGERLGSFIVEGLMDYALGRAVTGDSPGVLPPLPLRPDDLLEKLDLVIYPVLNPDGSADLDGDGDHDFDRFKCGIDMNRRWGTALEEEAYEVSLVHEDILREAQRGPFRLHRDFHGWGRDYQGGIRHGVGDWQDENGERAFSVSEEYHDTETALLEAEQERIPYRKVDNYLINHESNPPTPGTARFSLYRDLAATGLITLTSESAIEREEGRVITDPPYRSGSDLRMEGAWTLLTWYETLAELGAPAPTLIRGDVDRDGKLKLTDVIVIALHLFGGLKISCPEAADVDSNGELGMTDVIYLLDFLFAGGPQPLSPFPQPGVAPEGGLGCRQESL